MIAAALLLALAAPPPDPAGSWRAALDLAGGELRFGLEIARRGDAFHARLCNGPRCEPLSAVRVTPDSITFDIADYAATIAVARTGDSLVGVYHNVGTRGPRSIPFRAARGRWETKPGAKALLGRWDATFLLDRRTTPRVFEFRNRKAGLEGTVISNSGDYGLFAGTMVGDSFAIAHFDGSFVYLLAGRLDGDTLRGVFHAGPRTQTPWTAVRSTGAPHLTPPTAVTAADTAPFHFAFPGLDGRPVSDADARFRGKVVLIDIFGTWCPTCHDQAPVLVRLAREYRARGLEVVGLAYEVSGDTAVDGALVRRYRDKFGIDYALLLAGTSDVQSAAATLPQLDGFTAFPTTLFIDRTGRIRRVHAGFYGPATGAQHEHAVAEFRETIERLLAEPAR